MNLRVSATEVLVYINGLFEAQGQGAPGLLNADRPASALERPWASWDGDDLYPSLASKAAAILHGIVAGHPFSDGNKRAGLAAALLLLEKNGVTARADEGALYALTMGVASGESRDVELIAERLAELFGLEGGAADA